jgi:hypothetical protein
MTALGPRQIRDLEWAKTCLWPGAIPHPRPRKGSAKAAGLAYERALARQLGPEATPGQWFEFCDSAGHGWCQTDLLLVGRQQVLVMEVKYSWVPDAQAKLAGLYLPVVQRALGRPALGLVVAKRLTVETRGQARVAASLGDAVALARAGQKVVWHWLGPGSGPCVAGLRPAPPLTAAPVHL